MERTLKMNLRLPYQIKVTKNNLATLEEYKNSKDIWTVADLRQELKEYLSTQELEDRLTKLNRNKNDFEKKHEKTSDWIR